jgi:hypothetical protein
VNWKPMPWTLKWISESYNSSDPFEVILILILEFCVLIVSGWLLGVPLYYLIMLFASAAGS